jgi:hypothetical protein
VVVAVNLDGAERSPVLRRALDLRGKISLVFLEGSYSYKIDYIVRFRGIVKCCKLLKINGRGERI